MAETCGYRADVAVIGAGLAGLVTALELIEQDISVTLIDRDHQDRCGGLAREAFGGMLMVDTPVQRRTGIRDSCDLAWSDWQAFAEFEPDALWPRRWAQAYVEHSREALYEWLTAQGVKFFPVVHWVERGLYQPGNSVPRFHLVWGTGQELARIFTTRLREHPKRHLLQILFQHRVDGFTQRDGQVQGCHGQRETDGASFEFEAPVVVIACGGINGNLQQVRRYWHEDWGTAPPVLLNGAHAFADGRLHTAAQETGAALTHLDKMWNYAAGVHHPRPKRAAHGLSLVPCKSALWLNAKGERIGPTPLVSGFDTRDLVTQVCRQPGQYSWQILNQKIAHKELAVSGSEFNPAIRDRNWLGFLSILLRGNRTLVADLVANCPDFLVADTVAELAKKMNQLQPGSQVDPGKLQHTIGQYDAGIARGPRFHNDEQLRRIAQLRQYPGDRARTCRFQPILDPRAGPLIAIREFIISRKSLGGIKTDLGSRVLDVFDEPVPGLFAVGEAAGFGGGGMHGLRSLEGTFLGGCVLTARHAARTIGGRKG